MGPRARACRSQYSFSLEGNTPAPAQVQSSMSAAMVEQYAQPALDIPVAPQRFNVTPEVFEKLMRGEPVLEEEITGSATAASAAPPVAAAPETVAAPTAGEKKKKKSKKVKVSKKK